MPTPTTGLPTAAQTILYTDALATNLVQAATAMGIGAVGESGTMSTVIATAISKILGDGSTNYGLGNPSWQQTITAPLQSAQGYERYDYLMNRQASLMQVLDSLVTSYIPDGWSFIGQRPFDAWLTRLNGATSAPATPPSAGVLTAATNVAGQLQNTSSGAAPRVLHTLVGANSQNESLATAEATQVAIAGANNAYSYQIAGTVPAGVFAVNTYRSFFGAGGAPYMFDKTTAVTPLAAYPAILILQNDSELRQDVLPPTWMQCCLSASAAAYYAFAYAVATVVGGPMAYNTGTGMISPGNVLLGPANGYIGYANTAQSATFGSSVITGASTSTFTAGAIQTSNNPATNLQGFAGATGLRARTAAGFTGTATPTITYTYYDAAHGWGNIQTVTGVTPVSVFSTPGANAVITYTITAGRVIRSVTETSMSGTATSGAYLFEGTFPR
jgi:hypothetical protein